MSVEASDPRRMMVFIMVFITGKLINSRNKKVFNLQFKTHIREYVGGGENKQDQ